MRSCGKAALCWAVIIRRGRVCGQRPNPPAPFPKREGGTVKGETTGAWNWSRRVPRRLFLGSSPPSRFGKGAGGLGLCPALATRSWLPAEQEDVRHKVLARRRMDAATDDF